jgi:hypothetical protein
MLRLDSKHNNSDKVRDLNDDPGEFTTYLKTEEYKEDIVVEILYHLSLKVFGSDHEGKSAYIQLRRTIHQFKVDLSFEIQTWAERMEDFQSYLPYRLWNAGERWQEKPRSFMECKMQEILEHSLLFEQLTELCNMDWSIQDQPYKEIITKLEGWKHQSLTGFQLWPIMMGHFLESFLGGVSLSKLDCLKGSELTIVLYLLLYSI